MQKPEIKKANRYSLLWLFPLVALLIGLSLAYQHLSAIGPTITIQFSTADGIEANKTKIRYKDLDIGTVNDISLTDDMQNVVVSAQMTTTAAPLLKKDSELWVVRPQISAAGITGLSTLISGSYIAIDPGTSDSSSTHFIGLEKPPLTKVSEPGVRIKLATNNTKGLNTGSPVYYWGFKVGQIEQIYFNEKIDLIYVDAFVNSPYDKLINSNTKFWNASGFDFRVSANGADFDMKSLETLVLGGISFSTPMSLLSDNLTLDSNTVFTLYSSEQAINQPTSFDKQYYVLYFDDSIRGLSTGAPVEFNGINVGEVVDIRLLYDDASKKAVIPVLIDIEVDRIDRVNSQNTGQDKDIISALVSNGMHASMETGSLLTGEKFIRLSMQPGTPGELTQDHYSSYSVLPVSGNSLNQITDNVSALIAKINQLPLKSLVKSANDVIDEAGGTITAARRVLEEPGIQNLGNSLQSTLTSIQSASNNAGSMLKSAKSEIASLSQQLENTLYGLSPDSSLYYSLQQTLNNLQMAAKSVDRLAKMLDEKPNALILGD